MPVIKTKDGEQSPDNRNPIISTSNAKGLGRGLTALLGEEANREANSQFTMLRLAQIEPNADQPRKDFKDEALADLADSIRQHGVLMPLVVRRQASGNYQIIAGERRWRAARMAGQTHLPVVIKDVDDLETMELSLIENLQREDLNPLEIADGYRILISEFGKTQEEVATTVGRSRSAVANLLRLLTLEADVKSLLRSGAISEGHARALIPLNGSSEQIKAAKHIADTGMSVRQTEEYIKKLLEPTKSQKTSQNLDEVGRYLAEHETRLSERLQRRVKIVAGHDNTGHIKLDFYNADDFDALMDFLEKLSHNYN